MARGNPSPEALKAVGTFEDIDLDGPEAVWMLSHDFLAQNCKICVNFCIFWDSMAAIFLGQSWNFDVFSGLGFAYFSWCELTRFWFGSQ